MWMCLVKIGLGVSCTVRCVGVVYSWVCVCSQGTVRYVGVLSLSEGQWLGIELDTPDGDSSGRRNARKYFDCKPHHGLFVRPEQVTALSGKFTLNSYLFNLGQMMNYNQTS